jgi:psiF repeat
MIQHSLNVLVFAGAVAVLSTTNPTYSADNPQQQRMKDCNAQAIGMSGDARQKFMSSCLSGKTAETKTRNCVNGKPCGNSCIAKDKVCRK